MNHGEVGKISIRDGKWCSAGIYAIVGEDTVTGAWIKLIHPDGGQHFCKKDKVMVEWIGNDLALNEIIYFSYNGGKDWIKLAECGEVDCNNFENGWYYIHRKEIIIPDIEGFESDKCLIKVVQLLDSTTTISDESDDYFWVSEPKLSLSGFPHPCFYSPYFLGPPEEQRCAILRWKWKGCQPSWLLRYELYAAEGAYTNTEEAKGKWKLKKVYPPSYCFYLYCGDTLEQPYEVTSWVMVGVLPEEFNPEDNPNDGLPPGVRSNIVVIRSGEGDEDPIVDSCYNMSPTAFTNSNKIIITLDARIHMVYSGDSSKIYYAYSDDRGRTWIKTPVGYGKFPNLLLSPSGVPLIIWTDTENIYYRSVENPEVKIAFSSSSVLFPCFVLTSYGYYGTWLSRIGNGFALVEGVFEAGDSLILTSIDTLDYITNDTTQRASVSVFQNGEPFLVWSKDGEIFIKEGLLAVPYSITTDFPYAAEKPVISCYGDRIGVVWEAEDSTGVRDIYYRCKGPEGWSEIINITHGTGNHSNPVITGASQVIWEGKMNQIKDIYYWGIYKDGALTLSQNMTQTPAHSYYPNVIHFPDTSNTYLIYSLTQAPFKDSLDTTGVIMSDVEPAPPAVWIKFYSTSIP